MKELTIIIPTITVNGAGQRAAEAIFYFDIHVFAGWAAKYYDK